MHIKWVSKPEYYFFLLLILIYSCNLFVDVMEVDAAQYAAIAQEMLEKGSFLQVFERNNDYLDKPPMLFWLASLSYFVLGVSSMSYKLPSVIILVAGLYATYRIGKLYYSANVGNYAALILGSTQAYLLITNDVRTDGILLGFTVLAIWQMAEFIEQNKIYNLVLSAVFLAAALMAKGPLALIIFLAGIGTHILLNRQWKLLFNWHWAPYFIIVGTCLLPMCYGLYTQFDLHPEKVVYDLVGPSGIKFYFWTQSFGRITGDNYWKNDTSFFTFFHTFFWDYQPWALCAVIALFYKVKQVYAAILGKVNGEFISFGAFLFPFLALSLSKFKLPHYIFPLFPYMSIVLAQFLVQMFEAFKYKKLLLYIQFGLMHVFYIALLISYFYFFKVNNWIVVLVWVFGLLAFYYFFSQKNIALFKKYAAISLITTIVFGINLSLYFYPNLLRYQSESVLGKQIGQGKYDKTKIYCLETTGHSLDFYGDYIFPKIQRHKVFILPVGSYIFADEVSKIELLKMENYSLVDTYEDFPVTQLNIKFLNEKTRNSKLKRQYLILKTL